MTAGQALLLALGVFLLALDVLATLRPATRSTDADMRPLHALVLLPAMLPRLVFRAWFVYVAWGLLPSQGFDVSFSVLLAAWALSAPKETPVDPA